MAKYITVCVVIICLSLSCISRSKDTTVRLHYDLYGKHGLEKSNAITVEYDNRNGIKYVTIQEDSIQIKYREKIEKDGIYRNSTDSSFQKVYSFTKGEKVESNIGIVLPMLINNWTTFINEYKFRANSTDSAENIIFYDEVIPFYAYTSSYYLKSTNTFLIFYDQQKDNYLKLSQIVGLDQSEETLRIANDLAKDTIFFGRYYRLPDLEPPPKK